MGCEAPRSGKKHFIPSGNAVGVLAEKNKTGPRNNAVDIKGADGRENKNKVTRKK